MRPTARAIRKVFRAAGLHGGWRRNWYGAWVRQSDDGTVWAGATAGGMTCGGEPLRRLVAVLEAAGYRCELNGKPGTSGEHIIDVFPAKSGPLEAVEPGEATLGALPPESR